MRRIVRVRIDALRLGHDRAAGPPEALRAALTEALGAALDAHARGGPVAWPAAARTDLRQAAAAVSARIAARGGLAGLDGGGGE